MSIPRSKKRRIIIIIIIVMGLMDDALVNNENADTSLYESVLDMGHCAKHHFWDTTESNWTNDETSAWAAVEALAETLENQQGDEKIADMAGQLDTALEAI